MDPLIGAKAVEFLARVRDFGPSRIRHRISGQDVVFETDHRRCTPLLGDALGAEPREFYQVIVGFEADDVVIRARHIVEHRGIARLDPTVPCPTHFALSRVSPRCAQQVGRMLARILRNPQLIVPCEGRWFPRTGWPAIVD